LIPAAAEAVAEGTAADDAGAVVTALEVVAEAGGGTAEIVPVAVEIDGAVSVRDSVWSVAELLDTLGVMLLAASLLASTLLAATLLATTLLAATLLAATLLATTLLATTLLATTLLATTLLATTLPAATLLETATMLLEVLLAARLAVLLAPLTEVLELWQLARTEASPSAARVLQRTDITNESASGRRSKIYQEGWANEQRP
jgi:hypothetical protein